MRFERIIDKNDYTIIVNDEVREIEVENNCLYCSFDKERIRSIIFKQGDEEIMNVKETPFEGNIISLQIPLGMNNDTTCMRCYNGKKEYINFVESMSIQNDKITKVEQMSSDLKNINDCIQRLKNIEQEISLGNVILKK